MSSSRGSTSRGKSNNDPVGNDTSLRQSRRQSTQPASNAPERRADDTAANAASNGSTASRSEHNLAQDSDDEDNEESSDDARSSKGGSHKRRRDSGSESDSSQGPLKRARLTSTKSARKIGLAKELEDLNGALTRHRREPQPEPNTPKFTYEQVLRMNPSQFVENGIGVCAVRKGEKGMVEWIKAKKDLRKLQKRIRDDFPNIEPDATLSEQAQANNADEGSDSGSKLTPCPSDLSDDILSARGDAPVDLSTNAPDKAPALSDDRSAVRSVSAAPHTFVAPIANMTLSPQLQVNITALDVDIGNMLNIARFTINDSASDSRPSIAKDDPPIPRELGDTAREVRIRATRTLQDEVERAFRVYCDTCKEGERGGG